jgi:hypothetical protein
MRFQAAHRLEVDGIAGSATFAHLGLRSRPRHGAAHKSHRLHSQPRAPHRPPKRATAPTTGRRASHPAGATWIVWVMVLVLLGLGLLVTATRYTRRRRSHRFVAAPDMGRNRTASATVAPRVNPPVEAREEMVEAEPAERRSEGGDRPADGRHAATVAAGGDRVAPEMADHRPDKRADANGSFNLGALLEAQGDLAGAEAAYRHADGCGHAAAATNLGVLLEQQGDLAGARAAYRRAGERGDANGSFNLGVLLEEQGDLAGAKAAYARAGERDQTEVANMARAALLELRRGMQSPSAGGEGGDHHGA